MSTATKTDSIPSIGTSTALETTGAIQSGLALPVPGSTEAARFRQEAADMTAVLMQADSDPSAIVLWHGVPRKVGDLVAAWKKLAKEAESKRLNTRTK